ncbi:hypothetical protein GOEFS_061_00090 [Gordonia effusa NBRC 100432]|uniref:Usp family protein n=1 Tax=Gordonia effusa NBRC 100432 TaxID=1077974 RepID=H0R0R9_9ACTN|nr:hypothetical protein [Gordonia effusa]GAB18670.1 hypothetical protein GOEFS_061_00090 [Gordonia effusa NBRC 100432]
MKRMSHRDPRWREWQHLDRVARSGPIILGCTGSAASLRAVASAPTLVGPVPAAVLLCAVKPARARDTRRRDSDFDVLKADAYQLSESAIIDEALRRSREVAWDCGLKGVVTQTVFADPVHALRDAAIDNAASTVIVGVGGRRPSRLVNRLAAALPDGVDLIATDGTAPLVAIRRSRMSNGATDYFSGLRTSRLAIG